MPILQSSSALYTCVFLQPMDPWQSPRDVGNNGTELQPPTTAECVSTTNSLVFGLVVTDLVALAIASCCYITTIIYLACVRRFETVFEFVQGQVIHFISNPFLTYILALGWDPIWGGSSMVVLAA